MKTFETRRKKFRNKVPRLEQLEKEIATFKLDYFDVAP
jgi:hypothetical protein